MVTVSRETNASEGGMEIYEIRYAYEVDEETYYGKAYATGEYLEEGTPVTVEYITRNPAISRIPGMRTSMFGPIVIVTLIFPLVGLIFIAVTVHNGRKAHRLLKHGRMTRGTLISREITNVRINRRPVYKLVFEFEGGDGEIYHTTAKTHLPEELEDESLERLLYDPDNPSYAVMLDKLPVSPDIDASGNFALPSRETLRTFLRLIIPAITLIGHGMYIYLKYSP